MSAIFFQVKIEEYDNYDEYCKDTFINDDIMVQGRTNLNFPKGCTFSYIKSNENKMSYLYPVLNLSNDEYQNWIKENKEKIENERS